MLMRCSTTSLSKERLARSILAMMKTSRWVKKGPWLASTRYLTSRSPSSLTKRSRLTSKLR
ncbi:hypothetical protein [Limosilactobacillus fermentum]|uniref:hypothetical protein n=1 Tax=Limosilactobacillus fermentum TaxID=1613 RepID=UPI0012FE43AB|nr:hypothetical protein [Limosilactobacillus fermentum]